MDKNSPIIKLTDITFNYPGASPAIESLNFSFERGRRIGLLGPNGSGKTTIFHIIMGLLSPSRGKIEIFGKPMNTEKDFRKIRKRIGLLFQDADDQLFSPTVLEDVAFGPLNLGKTRAEAIEIANKTLSFLGLDGFGERITYKLSGGEKRLVSLATVLSMKPEVLLLDEPTTGLDEKTKEKLIKVLSGLDISFILISHNMDFLSRLTDSIYMMDHGKLFSDESVHLHEHVHAHRHGAHEHVHKG